MWKWFAIAMGVIVVAMLGFAGYVVATGLHSPHPVGFQIARVADGNRAPLQVGIWYPTTASPRPMLLGFVVQYVAGDAPIKGEKLPLVVISHGNGGGVASHADTALALAAAGFVVAAPVHTGDNFADQSAVGGPRWFIDRSRHIKATIDFMLNNWRDRARIDPARIGLFGFSAGGTTALISIGGEPDFAALARHCAQIPEFACQLWKPDKAPLSNASVHDPRIKAAVIAAPGYGFAFVPNGLTRVSVPIQLWNGVADENVPVATNAEPVRAALPGHAELHLVRDARHFSFLVPCGAMGVLAPPMLCSERPGFDRKAFHRNFDAEVVKFFDAKLNRR